MPTEFPTVDAYLDYVEECERSMEYEVTHTEEITKSGMRVFTPDRIKVDMFGATEIIRPDRHYAECEDNIDIDKLCWCNGDEYGFMYNWARGGETAQHTTHPMFTIKNDIGWHQLDKPNCAWCHPEEFYWHETGKKMSRAAAEREFWKEWHRDIECYLELYFSEFGLPVPPYEPDKNGSHP